jgi:hypothetical protein
MGPSPYSKQLLILRVNLLLLWYRELQLTLFLYFLFLSAVTGMQPLGPTGPRKGPNCDGTEQTQVFQGRRMVFPLPVSLDFTSVVGLN